MTAFTLYNEQGKAIYFEQNDKGYCYKEGAGQKKTRISKAEFEEAKEQKQIEEAKAEVEEQEIKAEAKKHKKTKRAKKNVAFTATIELADDKIADVTLTQKQLDFLNRVPESDEFIQGAESTFYTDLYCDTVADLMNAMVVGAIISTLREKDLIYIGQGKVNGKKCKYFGFTDLGKAMLKALGLV